MNIFRITIISIPLLVVSTLAFADSEDKKKSGAAEPVTPIEEPKAEVAPPPKVEEPAPAPPPQPVSVTQTTAAEAPIAPPKGMPGASNAFELGVGTGYTQGFGSLQSGVGMPSVAEAGAGIDLSFGYRIDPSWSLSLDGQYYNVNSVRGSEAQGMTATFAGTYHFVPNGGVDPWVQLGVGYRGLWENRNAATLYTGGLQAGRLRAGLDFRASTEVAIGPVIGADANVFLTQNLGLGGGGANISSPTVNTFIYAGLQGRFDIGGSSSSSSASNSSSGSSVAKR